MMLVDYRAGSKEVAPLLTIPHEVAELDYGDMSFIGHGPDDTMLAIAVERKTVMDLVNSMVSGRLSGHQLHGLMDQYDHVYLVVEGLWRPNRSSGLLERWVRGKWYPLELGSRRFMAKEIGNYLNTLAVICGVHVWRTDSLHHTARWLGDLYRWWQKPWGKHRSHLQMHAGVTPPTGVYLRKPKPVERVATQFTGVGWDKARALAKVFPSVLEFVLAGEGELQRADGIGKKLACSIREEIQGQ
jgi:ERCC4-type nuclease